MLEDGWREGPVVDARARWDPADVGAAVDKLLSERVAPRKVWGTACIFKDGISPLPKNR
jgi:hypothetical protein